MAEQEESKEKEDIRMKETGMEGETGMEEQTGREDPKCQFDVELVVIENEEIVTYLRSDTVGSNL